MNCSVYFFGELGQGYTQSPDDDTRNLLETFFVKGQKGSRLSFVHEGRLAYYGYTRPLKARDSYFGICCVFNDVFCNDYKSLFSLFEETITYLVVEGKVLEFDESGDVVPAVGWLYQASAEINRASERILTQLQRMEGAFVKLPPVNYATASAATRTYALDDSPWSILEDMEKYPRVVVTKDFDIDSQSLASYSGRLHSLHSQVVQLEEGLDKVKKQKKRNTLVVILMFILVLTGSGLYQVWVLSNEKQNTIDTQKENINDLVAAKNGLETDLLRSDSSLKAMRDNYKDLSEQYDELRETYDHLCEIPFSTGANPSECLGNFFNNTWVLWLKASVPVQIESFCVKASKTGNLTLGLFDGDGRIIDTMNANVKEYEFVEISPSGFSMDSAGYYYLGIHSNRDDVSLSYHGNATFSNCKGALQVVGSSSKGKNINEIETSYYMFFYDIKYKLKKR